MKWSWKLGRFAGVDVFVHATFGLLVAWVVFSGWFSGRSLGAALDGAAFLLLLFGSVLLHEFGHSLAARRFGIRTKHITLLPIGGVAELERIPEEPKQELLVALAGPAVNVGIAAVLAAGMAVTGGLSLEGMAGRLLAANVFLVLFNMLPAFPMDGGRVLRALLATRLEFARATRYAATAGQVMAALFAVVGLFANPMLLLVALFVWIGASQEARGVELRHALRGIPVERTMLTEFRTLAPEDPLPRAVELVLRGSQREFPVEKGGRVLGIVTVEDLAGALSGPRAYRNVADVMRPGDLTVESLEPVDAVLERLQASGVPAIAVTERGRLVGLFTTENVSEFLALRRVFT